MSTLDPSRLCQIEIMVHDLKREQEFLYNAFGWKSVPAQMHRYVILDVPKHCSFGLSLIPGRLPDHRPRPTMTLYFGSARPDRIIEQAKQSGAVQVSGPKALPGYGQIWHITDPEGIVWGIYQNEADEDERTPDRNAKNL